MDERDFWKKNAEINYKNIPKKIICEKFISSQNSYYPVDYKIYCFNGEPIFIGVFIERNKETFKVRRGYFNFNWELQNFLIDNNQNNPNDFPKPKYLNEMYKIAKDLSKPFPFVRIDFYESEDRIIFGEFTFTPSACLADYYNKETLEKLGDLLVLPSRE